MSESDIENIEIQLLVEAIKSCYGYDFRHYARASLKRRILQGVSKSGVKTISDMIPRLIHDPKFFSFLLTDFSIVVTEMFRDPKFYVMMRKKVMPVLKSYPFIKIWHAGCASGEEVYSMAVMLKEEGLYDRAQIYATDFNDVALKMAKDGIYPMKNIKKYTSNYQKSGGKASLADYYHGKYDSVIMNKSLKKNIVFANHNLATDEVFGEINLILCRNVLIYFDRTLQNRVFGLFKDSLCHNGFLCLGNRESLLFSNIQDDFIDFSKNEKIYQRKMWRTKTS